MCEEMRMRKLVSTNEANTDDAGVGDMKNSCLELALLQLFLPKINEVFTLSFNAFPSSSDAADVAPFNFSPVLSFSISQHAFV